MNNYNDLKEIWNHQSNNTNSEIPQSLQNKINKADKVVNNAHVNTIIILALVMIFMTAGYLLLFRQSNLISVLGITAINLALLIRIFVEWISYQRLKTLDVMNETPQFAAQISGYYQWRSKIHGYPTWLTVSLYAIGVALLFTQFKIYLPTFWFNFFLIELGVIAVVLFYFIRKWIRKEMQSLNSLVEIYDGIAN